MTKTGERWGEGAIFAVGDCVGKLSFFFFGRFGRKWFQKGVGGFVGRFGRFGRLVPSGISWHSRLEYPHFNRKCIDSIRGPHFPASYVRWSRSVPSPRNFTASWDPWRPWWERKTFSGWTYWVKRAIFRGELWNFRGVPICVWKWAQTSLKTIGFSPLPPCRKKAVAAAMVQIKPGKSRSTGKYPLVNKHNHGNSPFWLVNSIKVVDFPWRTVSLPEGVWNYLPLLNLGAHQPVLPRPESKGRRGFPIPQASDHLWWIQNPQNPWKMGEITP